MKNYERKYNDLVKAVKELQEANPSDEGIQNWVNENVPELKESEDEKIKEQVIYAIEQLHVCECTKDKLRAWLEKQGNIDLEFFENGENEKREFVGYGFLKCKGDFLSFKEGETYWLEYIGKDNYNVRSDNLLGQTFHITPQQLYTVFRPTTWLEKQGEQKSFDYENANIQQKDFAPKVEPKFHEGDWVVQENIGVFKVIEICESWYEVIDAEDNHYSISFDKEYMCRLWDITKDAKDGDVLVASDGSIFIFKEVVDNGCKHYIALTNDNIVKVNIGLKHFWETVTGVKPAAKEQRDKLEKAMADAGYTFDFKKKELKRIEQNSAWSEEDEMIALSIEQVMNCASLLNIVPEKIDKIRNWLKSLKGKVYPQPKQEWNEEDEYNFAFIQEALLGLDGDDSYREKCCKMADWLDSLKGRVGHFDDGYKVGFSAAKHNQWKPSDEQLCALEHATMYNTLNVNDAANLATLYNDLKKLKRNYD